MKMEKDQLSNSGEFCPIACTMQELEKRIKELKNGKKMAKKWVKDVKKEVKFLEGVEYCRVVMHVATGGQIN